MLKLPKGLKKKKKGKKSKRKEDELFTEAELEQYRREHQQPPQQEAGAPAKENEEWSKYKDLTSGVDSILKRTQGDLDRIKSTSFFQRVPAGVKEVEPRQAPKEEPRRPVVEVTEADFPHLAKAAAAEEEHSECGVTDDESEEEEEQDDIFDTSYVEAVERGEVKLAYVPDSPDDLADDDIFDTSHVDAIIRGQENKASKGKKGIDIGVAVEVLTGRIDNFALTTTRRPKRAIPGDLLLESTDKDTSIAAAPVSEPIEKSILDIDSDIPISSPIDLSVSLHTALLQQQNKAVSQEDFSINEKPTEKTNEDEEEFDEFTLLAAESLEASTAATKLAEEKIKLEPVLQESWSAFEADKNKSVFAECIVEDQIDVDPYLGQDDPFDTSFAVAVVPAKQLHLTKEAIILEDEDDDDDDFDPRAEEIHARLNNRRKSSVRIHLTDPSGTRESITSDDIIDKQEEPPVSHDFLGGSTTDLTQLGDSPLDPVDIKNSEIDPFDTTIVDKIVAPGRVELKFLEQELIGAVPTSTVYRVPSDPDFDPRADESQKLERRASRPENLSVSKSVYFDVDGEEVVEVETKQKPAKPVTPYYTRELSITEDTNEETETTDTVRDTLTRTRSDEDLAPKIGYAAKRRHSEYPQSDKRNLKASDLLHSSHGEIPVKVLTPSAPAPLQESIEETNIDPFDTSFATDIAPSKTELKLLAKEFSCEDSTNTLNADGKPDLLDPADDIFQVKALTPEPSDSARTNTQSYDPFDTSFAGDLNPGRTEIKLLESEFLN